MRCQAVSGPRERDLILRRYRCYHGAILFLDFIASTFLLSRWALKGRGSIHSRSPGRAGAFPSRHTRMPEHCARRYAGPAVRNSVRRFATSHRPLEQFRQFLRPLEYPFFREVQNVGRGERALDVTSHGVHCLSDSSVAIRGACVQHDPCRIVESVQDLVGLNGQLRPELRLELPRPVRLDACRVRESRGAPPPKTAVQYSRCVVTSPLQ